MSNLIEQARLQVMDLVNAAYERAGADGTLPAGAQVKGGVDIPKDVSLGDFASSFAMAGARALHTSPKKIADAICSHLELEGSYFQKVEVAGPGFLNFTLGPKWYGEVLASIESEGSAYGSSDEGKGQKVMVEFVSANPTGPMHMGNARGGVLGDTLANVLARLGYTAWKEFYVNDAGNQIHKFATSIYARCMQQVAAEKAHPFPAEYLAGDEIRDLASGFLSFWSRSHEHEEEPVLFPDGADKAKWLQEIETYARSNHRWQEDEHFAVSVYERCLQQIEGEKLYAFPDEGYKGDDIRALAAGFLSQCSEEFPGAKTEEEWLEPMSAYGLAINIPRMKEDLLRYGISYDEWFFESSLHESGYVAETVQMLTDRGWTYEKDGALWLDTTGLLKKKYLAEGKSQKQVDKLDLKDDVLRRGNGFYTYFAADIAYHRNKFEKRGFDKVINVWGADHHGHVARLQAALDGLGLDGSHRLVIVLMQLVNLLQDGKPVRMSKRSGKAIALHDLLDEISVDAARYFFNSRAAATPLDFDLDLAVRQDSENPVYYVQYAHARICSLVERLAEEGATVQAAADVDASLLTTAEELALVRSLAQYPKELQQAGKENDPSRINRYLVALAGDFHRFYNACRIKGEEPAVLAVRLKLADTVRSVLANGLGLLGVSAPVHM